MNPLNLRNLKKKPLKDEAESATEAASETPASEASESASTTAKPKPGGGLASLLKKKKLA